MEHKDKVTVLMSTYNGERYVREQINSILEQIGVDVSLIIRDDGSKDATCIILEELARNERRIEVVFDYNIGVTESYYMLCRYAAKKEPHADYYAFADQDDIWKSNKLETAVKWLEKFRNDRPRLYYSNLLMVDENLNKIGMLIPDGYVKNTKQQSLGEVTAYGCTCVFDYLALFEMSKVNSIKYPVYHDNWLYMMCMFIGSVYYDRVSYILYRQHGDNASGKKVKGIKLLANRMQKLLHINEQGHLYEDICSQLIELYDGIIAEEDKEIIHKISNYRHNICTKLSLLFTGKNMTRHIFKDICIKARILLNHL